jgi:hypothetical protein
VTVVDPSSDPTLTQREAEPGDLTSAVTADGEVPFAVLPDGRVIMARFRTTVTPQRPSSLSDPEHTEWALSLEARTFRVTSADEHEPSWLPIDGRWARGDQAPLPAVADGNRHVVSCDYFYAHHLGWLTGTVTLGFDTQGMTVAVHKNLRFEPD